MVVKNITFELKKINIAVIIVTCEMRKKKMRWWHTNDFVSQIII